MLERDDKKKHCYTIKRISSSNYAYQDAKQFCEDMGGILPEVRGPKDYSNILGVITHTVSNNILLKLFFYSKNDGKQIILAILLLMYHCVAVYLVDIHWVI